MSRALLALLQALQPDDWARPTACVSWSVKDTVAHLATRQFRIAGDSALGEWVLRMVSIMA